MRRALLALALAALLTTAGCAGTFGGDPAGTERTTTTTATTDSPADTTSDSTPTETDRFPSGVTDGGLADANALVSAHADALDGQSVTLRERQVREYGESDRGWRQNRTLRIAANRTRFLLRTVTDDKPVFGASEGRVAAFADGEYVYRKVETPNSSWTDVLRGPNGDPEDPHTVAPDAVRSEDLRVALTAFALNGSENVRRSTDDPRRYNLQSAEVAHPELLASLLDVDTVKNASLELVVTSEGRVVDYRVEFVGTERGQEVGGTATMAYSTVGETEVPTPPWSTELEERVEGNETSNTTE